MVVVWCDDSRRDGGPAGRRAAGRDGDREDGRAAALTATAAFRRCLRRSGLSNTAMGAMIGMMAGPAQLLARSLAGRST